MYVFIKVTKAICLSTFFKGMPKIKNKWWHSYKLNALKRDFKGLCLYLYLIIGYLAFFLKTYGIYKSINFTF